MPGEQAADRLATIERDLGATADQVLEDAGEQPGAGLPAEAEEFVETEGQSEDGDYYDDPDADPTATAGATALTQEDIDSRLTAGIHNADFRGLDWPQARQLLDAIAQQDPNAAKGYPMRWQDYAEGKRETNQLMQTLQGQQQYGPPPAPGQYPAPPMPQGFPAEQTPPPIDPMG